MKKLHNTILKLNELSYKILSELNEVSPSLEKIKQEMSNREEYLQVLSSVQKKHSETKFSVEESNVLHPLFDAFTHMNTEIQKRISNLLNYQMEKLATAKKQRKIQDSYENITIPNISYF